MEFSVVVAPLQGAVGLDVSGLPLAFAGAANALVLSVLALRASVRMHLSIARKPVLRLIDGGKTEAQSGIAVPCGSA